MKISWLKETMVMVEGWQQEKSVLEVELEETKVEDLTAPTLKLVFDYFDIPLLIGKSIL